MIPKFPEFKPLTFEDKKLIQEHTDKFDPYSDFNFFSLWSWDTEGKRMISEHNGNLVVLITEYNTEEPLLSFLGTNKTEETVIDLIKYATENDISTTLRYVPEISVEKIKESKMLLVREDRDDYDYLFSVPELNALKGRKYKNKRQLYKWFESDNPDVEFIQKNLINTSNSDEIEAIIKIWENNKQNQEKDSDLEHETTAIYKLLSAQKADSITISSLRVNGVVSAFSIDETLPEGYVISHFCKADSSYRGIYDYLNTKITERLLQKEAKFWNWEQDLGIEGLRSAKMNYRPIAFLKKFRIELK